ncbi:MAG: endolytic transglycosylase MltG, partial [Actinobacteria bacterium]|nr:endolytic transglycosylase MltG [Actinomycetota bacterium]
MTGSPDDASARHPRPSSGRPVTPARRRPSDAWADLEPSFTADGPELGPRRGPRHPRDGKRRRRVLGYLLVAVFAFILGTGTGYARGYFASGDLGREVTVVVPTGATLSSIARQLEAKGVVKHARAFVIHAESDGYATKFMPGTYVFHENEPYPNLVALLAKGVRPPTVKVSIPEGTTLKQA